MPGMPNPDSSRGGRETIYRRWHSKGAVVLDAILSQVGEIIRFPESGDVAADLRAQMSAAVRLFSRLPGRPSPDGGTGPASARTSV